MRGGRLKVPRPAFWETQTTTTPKEADVTTGFTVAIIVLPIAWLLCLTVVIWTIVSFARNYGDELTGLGLTLGGIALIVITIGGLVGLYPYNMAYHSWHVKQGTVAHISSRLLSAGDGGGSDQKFVVQFAGSPQLYGVNDTRAATVKAGDHLRITCVRTHQWGGGVDGYDCRWDQ